MNDDGQELLRIETTTKANCFDYIESRLSFGKRTTAIGESHVVYSNELEHHAVFNAVSGSGAKQMHNEV